MPRNIEMIVKAIAGLVLLKRSPSLFRASSHLGKSALALLLALAVTKSVRIGTKATLAATLTGLASSYFFQSSHLLRWIVAVGSAPVVAEALEGGDADMPAVGAILLGLLLDHCSAAAVILIMVTGGEALEEHALERAGSALHSLLERSPGTARLADSGVEVSADKIIDGQDVLVKHDEVVPVDGVLVSPEHCGVDERLLTGESVSVNKKIGDLIMAGSTNGSGYPIRLKARGRYEESVLQQMKSSLRSALERKGKIELVSKRLADAMTPLTVAVAALGLEFVIRVRRFSPEEAWRVVLSVLMSATPCPAAIGVPVALLSGMSVSSRLLGATVKSGEALESLSVAKVLVLDKTGTITTGRPVVSQFYFHQGDDGKATLDGKPIDLTLALNYVAHVEFQAKHVLADAVVREFESRGGSINKQITNFVNRPGEGVAGVVDGIEVRIGSKSFCIGETSSTGSRFRDHDSANHLVSYFNLRSSSSNESVSGTIAFEDPVREEAVQLVDRATNAGLTVVILSGDASSHLRYVANKLNICRFHTCLPHQKVERIRALQKEFGVVVMVGDGAYDSAALAAADVGISVDPTGMASESAKVVLLNGDVSKIYDLIRLSNHVVTIARRTVTWGMLASAVQMCVSATGTSSPFANAVTQELIDLASTLHSLRALHFK